MSDGPFPLASYPSNDFEEALQLSEARASLPRLVGLAEKQQRSVITKHGRPVAAIVPMADLDRLRSLDKERRKKMIFREPQDAKVMDFIEDDAQVVAVLNDETAAALAAAIVEMVSKNRNLLSLVSQDLIAQGFVSERDGDLERYDLAEKKFSVEHR